METESSIFVIEETKLHSLFTIKLFIKTNYFKFDACPRIIVNLDRLFTELYNVCDLKKKLGHVKKIKDMMVNLELITLCLALDNVFIKNCFVFNSVFDTIEYFF